MEESSIFLKAIKEDFEEKNFSYREQEKVKDI